MESALTEAQVTEVLEQNVSNLAFKGGLEIEFSLRRGVRVVYGAALEIYQQVLKRVGLASKG